MGVSGSGKTTIGQLLSAKTGTPFFGADDFHPIENKEKMKAGHPLTDADRQPWLEKLNELSREMTVSAGAIIGCSALKETYRTILSAGVGRPVWIFLKGRYDLIEKRMEKRTNHFMPPQLLQSQFASLEIPSSAFTIDIKNEPEVIVEMILQYLQNGEKTPL